jgi:hypothetical protein
MVSLDNTLDQSQSDAISLKFSIAVQTLKYTEQPTGVLHIKPGSIVLNSIADLLWPNPPRDVDSRVRSFAAILNRIRDEIGPNLAHHGDIRTNCREILDVDSQIR